MKRAAKSARYARAGVDTDAADRLAGRIAGLARRTAVPGVLGGIGGFGALFELPAGYREPVLVSGADGVGTKLSLGIELGLERRVGIDLVAMCVNDIATHGARPLFFLDCLACGRLDVGQAERLVAGVADGCAIAGCALVGGETAEMPGVYAPGQLDLTGFAVGIAEKSRLLPRADGIVPGDVVLGLGSSGAHSNGFSLLRQWVREGRLDLRERVGGRSLGEALMEPTRIYAAALAAALPWLKAAAHITGGGFDANLGRVLPAGVAARPDPAAWPSSELFGLLAERGGMPPGEMRAVFNCGVGMALVVGAADADDAARALESAGERVHRLGPLAAAPGAR